MIKTTVSVTPSSQLLVYLCIGSLTWLSGCVEVTSKTPAEQEEHKAQLAAEYVDKQQNSQNVAETTAEQAVTDVPSKDSTATDNSKTTMATQDANSSYKITDWQKLDITPLNVNKVGNAPAKVAKVVSTDENSLNFASQKATKYRFMANDAPFFDLVDSNKYLELHWYYANENDSAAEKQTSSDHAKKAHRFARQIMGDAGGEVVAKMLFGHETKNKEINEVQVALAKCEFYSCMLVLEKDFNFIDENDAETQADSTSSNNKADKN